MISFIFPMMINDVCKSLHTKSVMYAKYQSSLHTKSAE